MEELAPVLHMLVGLPRAGKSTIARQLKMPVVCLDDIRKRHYGVVYDASIEENVLGDAYHLIMRLFSEEGHKAVCLDATNTTKERRQRFIDPRWAVHYHILPTPKEVCIERAHTTGQHYLVSVIEEKLANWEDPVLDLRSEDKVSTVDWELFKNDNRSFLESFNDVVFMKDFREPMSDETLRALVAGREGVEFERDFVNAWVDPNKQVNNGMVEVMVVHSCASDTIQSDTSAPNNPLKYGNLDWKPENVDAVRLDRSVVAKAWTSLQPTTHSDSLFEKQMAELKSDFDSYKQELEMALSVYCPDSLTEGDPGCRVTPEQIRTALCDYWLKKWCRHHCLDAPVPKDNPFEFTEPPGLHWRQMPPDMTGDEMSDAADLIFGMFSNFDEFLSGLAQPELAISVFQPGVRDYAQALKKECLEKMEQK